MSTPHFTKFLWLKTCELVGEQRTANVSFCCSLEVLHEGDIVPHVVWWKFTGSGGAVAAVSLNTVVAQVNAPATHEYTTHTTDYAIALYYCYPL